MKFVLICDDESVSPTNEELWPILDDAIAIAAGHRTRAWTTIRGVGRSTAPTCGRTGARSASGRGSPPAIPTI
jgi:hypothetical protein